MVKTNKKQIIKQYNYIVGAANNAEGLRLGIIGVEIYANNPNLVSVIAIPKLIRKKVTSLVSSSLAETLNSLAALPAGYTEYMH